MKRFFRALYVWDGIWSIPASFVLVLLVGIAGQWVWGDDFAFFGPDVFQAIVVTALVLVSINFITLVGMYFNVGPIFKFLTSDAFRRNFNQLTPCVRVCISLACYFCLLLLGVAIYAVIA